MDLLEGELDAQWARQNELQGEIDALGQSVTDQQNALVQAQQAIQAQVLQAVGNNSGKARVCYRCNKEEHIARNCGHKPLVGPCYK